MKTGKPFETQGKHLAALDILKAIAILLVLTHHVLLGQQPFSQAAYAARTGSSQFLYVICWYTWFYLGKFGTTLFVGATGFLLARSFGRRIPSYGPWLWRKVNRLYVPYLLLIPFSMLVLASGPGFPELNAQELLATLSGFQPYFGFWSGSLNGGWWYVSLAVTVYIIFPVLFRVMETIGPKRFLVLAGMGSVISWMISIQYQSVLPRNFHEYFFMTHLITIAIGMVWAKASAIKIPRTFGVAPLLVGAFVILVWLANARGFPELTVDFFVARNVLFVLALCVLLPLELPLRRLRPLLWLSRYTYPIYLINLLVLQLMWSVMAWGVPFVFVFFPFAIAAGWVLQKIVDVQGPAVAAGRQFFVYAGAMIAASFLFLYLKETVYTLMGSSTYLLIGEFVFCALWLVCIRPLQHGH